MNLYTAPNRWLAILAILLIIGGLNMSISQVVFNNTNENEAWPAGRKEVFVTEKQARFTRETGGWVWNSDIEHVIEEKTGEIFLADAPKPFVLCGDKIPAGRYFELFPYHYYDKVEEDILARRINYKLVLKNISPTPNEIQIDGMGTTCDWDHYKTWEGALRGDGKRKIVLKPGEIFTLWEEKRLVGDLPWSGIVLGKATGDLWVCDYCYIGDQDPGFEHAPPQPDLAWPPYLLASYTRGGSDWNAAQVDLFADSRTADSHISLSALGENAYSAAIAFSPGGPITKLCEYNVVAPTFAADVFEALDPVSQKSHRFFGGNYPIMYKFAMPLANDTSERKEARLFLCSNDKLNVDSIVGVWMENKMLSRRVPMIGKNQRWRVFTTVLEPGENRTLEFIIVPLGSRWGGVIATLEFANSK